MKQKMPSWTYSLSHSKPAHLEVIMELFVTSSIRLRHRSNKRDITHSIALMNYASTSRCNGGQLNCGQVGLRCIFFAGVFGEQQVIVACRINYCVHACKPWSLPKYIVVISESYITSAVQWAVWAAYANGPFPVSKYQTEPGQSSRCARWCCHM